MERLLTTEEILALAQEHTKLDHWEKVRDQAQAICGTHAHKVTIGIGIKIRNASGEYPDTYYVAIYDKDGQLIWWDGVFPIGINVEQYLGELKSFTCSTYDEKKASLRLFPPFDASYQQETPIRPFSTADLAEYGIYTDYLLGQPPVLSFFKVYLKEGTNYQSQLRREKIITLANMHREYSSWEKIGKLVRNTYGPKAYTVIVEAYEQYDDDGGYYTLHAMKEVRDRAGQALLPDTNLPIWQNEDLLKPYWYLQEDMEDTNLQYQAYLYIIDDMLYREGISAIACNLELSPPLPPKIYTNANE